MRKAKPFEGKAHKRTVDDTKNERDSGYGRLHDYKDARDVEIFWDLSEEAKENQIFKLRIGARKSDDSGHDIEILLDNEELVRFTRWV